MNTNELFEDGPIVNFADRAEDTLKSVGDSAKRALQNFKTAHDETVQKQKTELKLQQKKEKEQQKKSQRKNEAALAGPRTAQLTVSSIILDRTPDKNDLPEFEGFSSDGLSNLIDAVDSVNSRFKRGLKTLAAHFKAASYIKDYEKNEIPGRLGDQNQSTVDVAEDKLMKNRFGERDAWLHVFLDDDPETGVKALVDFIAKTSKHNAQLNATQGKKFYAEGLNLINLIGAQRQILEKRIALMKQALEAHHTKALDREDLESEDDDELNESLKHKLRDLVKRM